MRCRLTRTLLALIVVVGSAPMALRGQEATGPLPGVFSEVLDVRVVNLEVVVTDKDGVPVVGIPPESFILKVDGEEVPVEYFSEIRRGTAVSRPVREGEDIVAELPAVVPGEGVETSYLVFIDEYFSIARDRDAVLKALIDDLPRLGPADRMAIVAFNGKQLEMLSTWSQTVPALERALKRAMERPTYGLQRLAEQRQFDFDSILLASTQIRVGSASAEQFLRTELDPNERFYLERLTEHIQRSVTAAALTLRSFAMPPGRKVLLLYSGGWPFFPVTFLGPNLSPIILSSQVETGAALFRPLSDTANLLGYTIYPVDVPGFNDLLSETSAASSGAASASSAQALQVGVGSSSFLRQQEVEYTLNFLAEETGGRAFVNSGRLKAFDEAVSDTRSYYWLGFTPQRDWDDRRHEVEVEVRSPGLRVRSRRGYLDSSPQHEVAMALESTLLFGNPASSDSLGVIVGDPRRAGRKRMEVPITILVPLDEVTFLPVEDQQVAQLELRIAVRDEQGRRAEIPVVPVVMQRASESVEGGFGRFDTSLKLRRLRHDAVLAIYDPASGRILSTGTEIAP